MQKPNKREYMKKSDLIKELIDDIAREGDVYILSHKISDENMTSSSYMLSPTRLDKDGYKAKMNRKEFKTFIAEQSAGEDDE